MRNIFRASLIGLAALGLAIPVSAFGIGLQPTTVEMQIRPGENQRQLVSIANVHTERTISLTLGLADWTLDENGQIELLPPGDSPVSAAAWTRFSPAFLTLEPGKGQQIIVDMSVPRRLDRSGDFRFALIASTILPDERSGQSGVWKKYQIASLFYLTTDPATSEPKITSSVVTLGEDGQPQLEFSLENTGNAHARLNGSVDFKSGGKTTSEPINNLVVLHEGQRNYVMRLPEDVDMGDPFEIKLENIFAPQNASNREYLPVFKDELVLREAALGPVDTSAPESSETGK